MPALSFSRIAAPAVVGGVFCLQLGGAIARQHFEDVGAIGATFLRLLIAAIILMILMRPRMFRWDRSTWLAAVLLGLALGAMNQLIYLAMDRIPLGIAITIEFLGPLTLALVQLRRWVEFVWAALALFGVVLIGFQIVDGLDAFGVLLALAAGACWAGYILASANLSRRSKAGSGGLAVSMLVGAIAAAPLGAGDASQALRDPVLLLIFVAVALMSSVVPYSIELKALRTLPTYVFGVLQSFGPAAGAVAGYLVLAEALRWQEVVALALVSGASIGISLSARRR
ncbi:EamA family transporter [Arenivirga flava]|uniref:DMT transporter permease n=1 Tax=Arenivirga flava TaxID=1930060 RepID=A0AA37UVY6_9MICO|nr:EamA family transporter [Arenivirga flava]GMA29842.1 DMT transporter permease [Arenivirga flava]